MSDAPADLPDPPRRRWGLFAAALLVAAVFGVLFEPTGIIRGRLAGEPFFASRPASYWERQLVAGPAERSQARQQFEESRGAGVAVLTWLLRSGGFAETRWTAAEILGSLGPDAESAAPALLDALQDPDPYVQSVAAEVVPQVGTPAADAVPALAVLLDGEHAPVAARAISVYRAQAAPALPQLLDVLTDTSRTADARWNAARTIGKTGPPAIDALPVLIEMTQDSEATVRGNAAEAIGDIGPSATDGIPALIDALDDPVARVRHHAVRSLGYIGPPAARALNQIKPLLDDPDDSVRREAEKALEAIAPGPIDEAEAAADASDSP